MTRTFSLIVLLALMTAAAPVRAQSPGEADPPAFDLWSSQIFTTTERPSFSELEDHIKKSKAK